MQTLDHNPEALDAGGVDPSVAAPALPLCRLQHFLDAVPDAAVFLSENLFACVNRASVRLLRATSPEQLLGSPWTDHVAAEWRHAAREHLHQALNGRGSSAPFRSLLVAFDGQEISVELQASRYSQPEAAGVLVFARELSPRPGTPAGPLSRPSSQAVVTTDFEGRITEVTAQARAILGLRAMPPCGGIMLGEWITPSDRPHVDAAFKRALRGEPANTCECLGRRADGSEFPLELEFEPNEGANGRPIGLAVILHDRSERLHAARAAWLAEERYQNLLRTVPVGIYRISPSGELLLANPALIRLLGFGSYAELLQACHGQRWFVGEERGAIYRRLAATGKLEAERTCWRRPDGSQIQTRESLTVIRGEDGRVLFYEGMVQDLSSEHAIEARLALQESALEAAAIAIAILDRKAKILWINSAFSRLTGYSREEAVGQNPRILKSGRQSAEFYRDLWSTVLTGKPWHGEIVNRRKDGSFFTEDMTIMPSLNADGHVTHFIAIKQDITERKQLEAQCLRAQRLQSIGLLAGGIAHDLNNLLSPIQMSIELLRGRLVDPEGVELIEMLSRSSQRGADIVRQVLTFARGVQGERLSIQPRHLVKELLRLISETFPRNIEIRTRIAAEVDPIIGDPTQLQQVLLNLCVNARDAMPGGGQLLLSAENAVVAEPVPGAQPESKPGSYMLFRVQDSGSGMAADVLERIFEPFFTTKAVGNGTGLGLPTALGIVRSHGGFIHVQSEVGHGSTFEIFLPVAPKAKLEPKKVDSKRKLTRGAGELVLVVDDESSVRQISRDLLTRFGYRVLAACDGAEAVEIAKRENGSLKAVVTDLMMPNMDGLAMTRELKKFNPALQVVATSGLTDDPHTLDILEEMRQLGVHHFLAKPYSAETLLQQVHLALHPDSAGNHGSVLTRRPAPEV